MKSRLKPSLLVSLALTSSACAQTAAIVSTTAGTTIDEWNGASKNTRLLERSIDENLLTLAHLRENFVRVGTQSDPTRKTVFDVGKLDGAARKGFLEDLKKNYFEILDDLDSLLSSAKPGATRDALIVRRTRELFLARLSMNGEGSDQQSLLSEDELKKALEQNKVAPPAKALAALEVEAKLRENLFDSSSFEKRNRKPAQVEGPGRYMAASESEARDVLESVQTRISSARETVLDARETPFYDLLRDAHNEVVRIHAPKVIEVIHMAKGAREQHKYFPIGGEEL